MTTAAVEMATGKSEVAVEEHGKRLLAVDDCVLYSVEHPDAYSATLRPVLRSDLSPASYQGLLGRCEREKRVLNLRQTGRELAEAWRS